MNVELLLSWMILTPLLQKLRLNQIIRERGKRILIRFLMWMRSKSPSKWLKRGVNPMEINVNPTWKRILFYVRTKR